MPPRAQTPPGKLLSFSGSKTVRLFHEHVLVKEPGADVPTPWHHDQPYYCVDGRQNVSLWAPLDPVGREVVPIGNEAARSVLEPARVR